MTLKGLSIDLINSENIYTYEELKIHQSKAISLVDEDDQADLLNALVRRFLAMGWISDAKASASFIKESSNGSMYSKADALILVGWMLAKSGLLDQAFIFLQNAENIIDMYEGEWQQAELLARISRILFDSGNLDLSIQLLEKATLIAKRGELKAAQDSMDSSSVLGEIAENMAIAGKTERSLQIAADINILAMRYGTINSIDNISNKGIMPSRKEFLLLDHLS